MSNFDSIFEDDDPTGFLSVIPTSVIDIEPQRKRKNENHSKESSRANYSPFPNEVATLCYEFFLKDSTLVFDPFAGWGERAFHAKKNKINYIGYDISEVAIKNALDNFNVQNELNDSFTSDIPEFDGFITCPPYWNLEKYNSNDGIDRIKTWDEFLVKYNTILSRCYDRAKHNTTFCIMVGEWRSKGIYYDFEYETRRIFKELGATIIDQIIVSRKKTSKIKIMLPQCKRLGYSVRVHETLLVFRKNYTG
jgi:DNA modification methylase